ncbi:hypothetical protein IW262DRAFT_1353652 [Armillaria fumosa]|nr:hypothetical protein IW262DRAFT_1353652 [Armillaria fumosa]
MEVTPSTVVEVAPPTTEETAVSVVLVRTRVAPPATVVTPPTTEVTISSRSLGALETGAAVSTAWMPPRLEVTPTPMIEVTTPPTDVNPPPTDVNPPPTDVNPPPTEVMPPPTDVTPPPTEVTPPTTEVTTPWRASIAAASTGPVLSSPSCFSAIARPARPPGRWAQSRMNTDRPRTANLDMVGGVALEKLLPPSNMGILIYVWGQC